MSAFAVAATTTEDVVLHEQQLLKTTADAGNSQTVVDADARHESEVCGKPK